MNTVWYDYDKVYNEKGTAIAIGNFDGLHLGHMKLMDMLSRVAAEHGIPSVAYTFAKHPINVIKGDKTLKLVADNEYKEELLATSGVDTLFFDDFEAIRELPPEDFVHDILVEKLNMKIAVVGLHNHYGKNSEGDVKLLRELGQRYGFLVYMIKPLYFGDFLCSSTKIRSLLEEGDIEKANELLGHRFKISNIVVKDKELGRTLGYPTANMIPDENILLPKFGVYATETIVDGERYKSITNVGTSPTVNDDNVRFETHILDFERDLYDKKISVEFLYRLRDDINFASIEDLKQQLKRDTQERLGENIPVASSQ